MTKRIALIIAAVVACVGILVLTMSADPRETSDPIDRPPRDLPDFGSLGPGQRAGDGFDESGANARRFQFTRRSENGQLYQFTGDSLEPLPEEEAQVTRPVIRIHMEPNVRVVEIRADSGKLFMPGNQPRRGDLTGNVVVTLYEATPPEKVIFGPDSPHAGLRLFVDKAQFDVELGRVETPVDQPVHLTSRQFDFTGQGMALTFNDLKKRVEKLEISRGDLLRISASAADQATGSADSSSSTHERLPINPLENRKKRQAYRASLIRTVYVESPAATMRGDRLDIHFRIDRDDRESIIRRGASAAQPARGRAVSGRLLPAAMAGAASLYSAAGSTPRVVNAALSAMHMQHAAPVTVTQDSEAVEDHTASEQARRSLMALDDSDVRVTWTGPLTVIPDEAPPPAVIDDGDTLMRFTGKPVRITTEKGDVIDAASVEYLVEAQEIKLTGERSQPVKINAPELGTIVGELLVLEQRTGTGYMLGAGRIESSRQRSPIDLLAGTDRNESIPPGMSVRWHERLDLRFYQDADDDRGGLSAIRAALFRGEVVVQHPEFGLRADQIGFEVAPPDSTDKMLEVITAAGNVWVKTRSEDPQKQLEMDADVLAIELDRGPGGKLEPKRLVATAHDLVEARTPGQVMRARELTVLLGRPSMRRQVIALRDPLNLAMLWNQPKPLPIFGVAHPSAPLLRWTAPLAEPPRLRDAQLFADPTDIVRVPRPDEAAGSDEAIELLELVARDEVHIEMSEPKLEVFASRLVADNELQQVELFGTDREPARMVNDDSTLVCQHFVINKLRDTFRVLGPGMLVFSSTNRMNIEEGAADAATRAPRNDKPGSVVTVNWDTSMQFDNRTRIAQFIGGTVTRARSGETFSNLVAEHLTLKFVEAAQRGIDVSEDPRQRRGVTNIVRDGKYALAWATARGDVKFVGETWKYAGKSKPSTRLTLVGPLLTFDYVSEQLQVIGEGRMLLEDYMPSDALALQRKRRIQQGSPDPLSNFSGQGASLFTWTGQMTVDAKVNDMTIMEGVQLLHVPQDTDNAMQLDADRFVADLEKTGGLATWLSSDAPEPKLRQIIATGDIRVTNDQYEALSDNLLYSGRDEVVTLYSDRENGTIMTDSDAATTTTARAIRWDLRTRKTRILEPGRFTLPVGLPPR